MPHARPTRLTILLCLLFAIAPQARPQATTAASARWYRGNTHCHTLNSDSAEITFVFGRPHPLQPSAGSAPYDSTVAEAMSDYWVAFATSGDPNGTPTAGKWLRFPCQRA